MISTQISRSFAAMISIAVLSVSFIGTPAYADESMVSDASSVEFVDAITETSTTTSSSADDMGNVTETIVTVSTQTTSSSTDDTASSTPDTIRPTGFFTSTSPIETGDNPIPFMVSFSEPIFGLTASLFNIGNGSATNLVSVSATDFTFDVVPAAPSGSVSVDLNGDLVLDSAGNYNTALPQIQRIYNSSLPNTIGTTTPPDTIAPVISNVSVIGTSTTSTPTLTFTSSEEGTIVYGGSCTSTTTMAVAGENSIMFSELSNNTYSDCTIAVTDAAGNMSTQAVIDSFVVEASDSDNGGGDSDDDDDDNSSGGGGNNSSGGSSSSNNDDDNDDDDDSTYSDWSLIGTNIGTPGTGFEGTAAGVTPGSGITGGNGTLALATDVDTVDTTDLVSTSTVASSTSMGMGSTTASTTDLAAAVGLASIPSYVWWIIVLIIAGILGITWYNRRNA